MNKTLSINLNSLVFQIDEIAYEKLSNYLKAIANRFKGMEGAEEITSDIEARIAEMFSEKLSNTKQVISLADVESVIEVMGRPEDFETIEDEMDEEPAASKSKKYPRKLFRDTDNSVLGGVCSGISAYLGISDPIFLRIIFLIAFFGFGSGFLLYIILWIVIPEAKTASDKLHMRGEAINISNIEKTITDEFEDIKNRLNSEKTGKAGSVFKNLLLNVARILVNLVMILVKILGVILIVVASISLMGLMVGGFAAIVSSDVSVFTLSDYFFANSFHKISSFVVVTLLILIPVLSIIYLGLKFLGSNRFRIPGFSKTISTLFFLAIIGLSGLAFYTSSLFYKSSTGSHKVELEEPYNGTYYIQGDYSFGTSNQNVKLLELGEFTIYNDQLMLGDRVELDVVRSMDNNAYLEIISKAKGSSREEAFDNQNTIEYRFEQKDSLLIFPYHFPLNEGQKIRAQKVQMHLHLPLGASIYLDHSSKKIIYDIKNVSNTYDGDMLGHTWQMQAAGLTCLDCNGGVNDFGSNKKKKNAALKDLSLNSDFNSVEINGSFDLQIEKGPFSFQSDSEEKITYTISGDKLTIESKNTESFFGSSPELIIQMPELFDLELNSASNALISGFDNKTMDLVISGANKCIIDVRPEKLNLELNGAAKVDLRGATEQLDLEINGASKLEAFEFQAQNADVEIAGASKSEIWVEKFLNAKVSGASSLVYKGLPEIDTDVSGFSSIKPIQ